MRVNNLQDFYFSQSALKVFNTCSLKFRYRYLDGLFWPRDWGHNQQHKKQLEWGRLFHRLALRYYDRGYVQPGDYIEARLQQWFARLQEFRPYRKQGEFLPEHELRLNQQGIRLLAKYDLMYVEPTRKKIIIYDWKTNEKQLLRDELLNDLQTVVYLYVLFKTSSYFPGDKLTADSIQLVYWNPRFPEEPMIISYSYKLQEKGERLLTAKIKEIKNYQYQDFQKTKNRKVCKYCEYRPICYGKETERIISEYEDESEDVNSFGMYTNI